MTHDDTDRNGTEGASNGTNTTAAGRSAGSLSRRRLLAGVGTAAAAGLAGCSGILGDGGGGDGDSGGGSADNVQNEVDGIEVTSTSGEVSDETYVITVNLENTGGEQTSVLDFDYQVTLYDESGSEIQSMGSMTINRGGFQNGGTGTVEIQPGMQADPSTVASYEIRILCDEGPYCE